MRLILIAAIVLVGSAAVAQRPPESSTPAPPRVPPITQPPGATIMAEPVALFIGACDADRDAVVTRAELKACVAHSYATIDTTGTGSLGYIGFADWAGKWLGDRNALPSPFETDSDGDDRITMAELSAQLDKTFTRLDRNKDNVLTRDELLTLDSRRGPERDERGGRRGRRGSPEQPPQ